MPKFSPNSTPKYRKHKASGQAVVTLNGTDYYLGPHGTKASRKEYDRLLAEWLASGRIGPDRNEAADLAIVELLNAYLRWARTYYGGSSEYDNSLLSVRPLKELYGRSNAAEFSPLKLKAVRQKMIAANLCRNEINKRIGRIKRIFRWAVENELIPSHVFHGLQAVRGLSFGRSDARESKPVKPVPEAFVALEPYVMPQIWAMIQLQRFTGMRPGEVTRMRTCDLETSGSVWTYTPATHKTAWRGHQRKIYLGPRAQAVLQPWLRADLQAYLFQPREAMATWRAKRATERKTPKSCGNLAGTNRKSNPKKQPSDLYEVRAYHQAIRQGCIKAGVPIWHPHQLRHNAATWLRKEFGLDAARAVLGHRTPTVTEVYAELDWDKAKQVMGKVG